MNWNLYFSTRLFVCYKKFKLQVHAWIIELTFWMLSYLISWTCSPASLPSLSAMTLLNLSVQSSSDAHGPWSVGYGLRPSSSNRCPLMGTKHTKWYASPKTVAKYDWLSISCFDLSFCFYVCTFGICQGIILFWVNFNISLFLFYALAVLLP